MTLLLLTASVIACVMLLMSVGVLLNNRCLRGTCGGEEFSDPTVNPSPAKPVHSARNGPVPTRR